MRVSPSNSTESVDTRFVIACVLMTLTPVSLEAARGAQREPTDDRGGLYDAEIDARVVKYIDYAESGNPRQTLDLYLPGTTAEGPLPVVCWIHGGAWRGGSKANANLILPLVKSGRFIGASIGYRLTNEAEWPAQIHDCKAAIRWIRANSSKYRIDPERIAVWGSSAGGHLAAMLGVTDVGDGLEGQIGPYRGVSSSVSGVVDYFGPTELLTMNEQGSSIDHDAAGSPESLLVGGPIQSHREAARNASPVSYVSKADKPILIIHGTQDALVPYQQSVVFSQRLKAAGVDAVLVGVDGGGHGRGFGKETTQIVQRFLENCLLGVRHPFEDALIPAADRAAPATTAQ